MNVKLKEKTDQIDDMAVMCVMQFTPMQPFQTDHLQTSISYLLAAWLKRVIEVWREWDDKKEKIGTDRLLSFISISRGGEVREQWKPERSY